MQQMTLQQVMDVVQTLPQEEQLTLVDLIQNNNRHEEFVQECNDALSAMEKGEFTTNSLAETLKALQQ
jgi:hypothetical protein